MDTFNILTRRAFLEKAATITAIGYAGPQLAVGAQDNSQSRPGPNTRQAISPTWSCGLLAFCLWDTRPWTR